MLIEARKQPTLERAYARYGRWLMARAFSAVRVGGAEWPAGDAPVIVFANHSGWWDPIVALVLSRHLFGCDSYGLMEGAQLTRYPFFRRIGCFGTVGETSPSEARALAHYAAETLRGGPRRALWLFPQGALLPARAPIAFRSGLARLHRAVPEARLVPVAIRYEMRAAQRPECLVRLGAPVAGLDASLGTAATTRALEARLRSALTALDAAVDSGTVADSGLVIAGRGSLSDLYDRARRALGEGRR